MEVPDVYRNENGNVSRTQLFDDLDQYMMGTDSDEMLVKGIVEELRARCGGGDEEFLRLVSEVVEGDATAFLDDSKELYGYGIMNVHQNSMIPLGEYASVQTGYFDNDVIVSGKEEILKAFKNFVLDHVNRTGSESFSQFRVVEVRLSNSVDEKAVEKVDEEVFGDE